MKSNKKKIILDFDDTLVRSSEQIIKMLNQEYHLTKSIKDLKDWGYKSIYPQMTTKKVIELYESDEFFNNVKLNKGVQKFLTRFKHTFQFIVCSKGNELNLSKKKNFCDKLFINMDYKFIGLPFTKEKNYQIDKSSIDFSDCWFCVEDNVTSLNSINSKYKILLKNNHEVYWNKTPINQTNIYVINDFNELIQICEFYLNIESEEINLE